MMIRVVLDACVLYSAPLRGFLLNIATDKLIFPFWSEEIQDEWTRSLLRKRPDLMPESIERTRKRMAFHFPGSLVRGHESIIPTLALPDPNDRHVLAAAIHVKATYIVTFNLDDFPKAVLQQYGIEAMSPDEFVQQLIQRAPLPFLLAVRNHRLSLLRPPKTTNEYLATLEKQRLPKTIAFLREHESDI